MSTTDRTLIDTGVLGAQDVRVVAEPSLATVATQSPILPSPVLDLSVQAGLIDEAFARARILNKVDLTGPVAIGANLGDVFTLARFQSPFKEQNDRGTCWAFAGAAALEAAYLRKFNILIDVSEEYIFHLGKAFELIRDAQGKALSPHENNTSLDGFQGSGDIVKKITDAAVPPESTAPYLPSEQALLDILPILGFANVNSLVTQEDFDAIEFCEQHIPLLARVNARYRATGFRTLGPSPSIDALQNTLLANHEVVCDVTHKSNPMGGHVLLLIGFDRNRKVFFAKNHWGENRFIEIAFANDPNWQINSGWFLEDVVDPTFVQNQACWLGNWWMTVGGNTNRVLLRRAEDFRNPGTPTKLGTAYLGDGPHDVNGLFPGDGSTIRLFVAPSTTPEVPGTLTGTQIDARLDFTDIYNASGTTANNRPVTLTRFTTRFAALFETDDGTSWQARHGIDGATFQATFDSLVAQGFRLTSVCGYSEGRDARYNAVWQQRPGPAWEARHGLTAGEYQATFDTLVQQGFRLVNVSGYAIGGEARYAAIWEKRSGPSWQARHGMSRSQYQQTFDDLARQGFVLKQVNGYRVNVDVQFAAIWEQEDGVEFEGRHGLTSSTHQKTFDELVAAGFRLGWVSGYSDTGIARYASVWRKSATDPGTPWQARHGLDSTGYQKTFDHLVTQGFRPVQVSGYGDGFYPA